MIIFEELSVPLLIKFFSKKGLNKKKNYFYIYSSKLDFFFKFLFNLLNIKFIQLKFRMIDIRNENGEIIREIIPREILFELENKYHNKIIHDNFKFKNFNNYKLKSFFSKHFFLKDSCFRIIYLILALEKIFNENSITLILKNVEHNYIYKDFVKNKKIDLIFLSSRKSHSISKLFLKKIIKNIIILINNFKFINFQKQNINSLNKVFTDGRSQPNLKNNGEFSDFFWLLNSNIDEKQVLYNCSSKDHYEYLKNTNINITLNFFYKKLTYNSFTNLFDLFKLIFNSNLNEKHNAIIKNNYEYTFNKWVNYFNYHKVKVYLNWYKYDEEHIAIYDAINSLDGIGTIYQKNFDGHQFYECKTISDIMFCFSKQTVEIDKRNLSNIKNYIITGYPSLRITNEMKYQASKVRNMLLKNGAKKILCVLDENSLDDERFHTGNKLQADNYEYILEKLLEDKRLGVIFKPKHFFSLKRRISSVFLLLEKAIKTGRCYIYGIDENTPYATNATPTLAALSSDFVVHSHLCAGTAAIECALINKPTFLIDREKNEKNAFHNLLSKDLIFDDWEDFINMLDDKFYNNEITLGNWKDIIHNFDPYGDNLASKRISDFIKDLIEGYDNGISKSIIIDNTIEKYIKKWGKDKVII